MLQMGQGRICGHRTFKAARRWKADHLQAFLSQASETLAQLVLGSFAATTATATTTTAVRVLSASVPGE